MKYLDIYLAIMTSLGFLTYGIDKIHAIYHKWRISEFTLLSISILGGCIGSIIGMYTFHHKTLKLKFHLLNLISLVIWIYILLKILEVIK